ncbi:EamA family transporter [Candidatus Saccharibacteria bacterium]|nr:EamA family transporter [Candidatus Saccharibacteria bacterium]
MNWLVLVSISTILYCINIFTDNYVSDYYFKGKGAVSQKLFYGWGWIVVTIPIVCFFWQEYVATPFLPLFILFVAGLMHGLAGIPYFRALELDDSTDLGIFIQLAPVLYLALGWMFLGETFSLLQLIAIAVILLAPILIVATTRKRSRKIRMRAVFYSIIYVTIAVIANLIFAKTDAGTLSIIPKIAMVFLGKGVANLIIVYSQPKLRKRFKYVAETSRKKVLVPLAINGTIGVFKEITYRAGLILAPAVAIASAASDSVTPVVIFFMGILLTLIWPKFGREKLNRKTVIVHLVATVLVVVGIVLLQF